MCRQLSLYDRRYNRTLNEWINITTHSTVIYFTLYSFTFYFQETDTLLSGGHELFQSSDSSTFPNQEAACLYVENIGA